MLILSPSNQKWLAISGNINIGQWTQYLYWLMSEMIPEKTYFLVILADHWLLSVKCFSNPKAAIIIRLCNIWSLREKCRNTGFLWSVFFRIWTDLYFPVFRQNWSLYFVQWIIVRGFLWNKGKPCKRIYYG